MFKNLFRKRLQPASVSHIALIEKLEQLLSEAVDLANANLSNPLLKINIKRDNPEQSREKSSPVRRLLLTNGERALSIKAVPGLVELYMLPASQALLIPESEYASRVKFKLEERTIDGQSIWMLDDAEIDDAVLRLMILASVNDLLREIKPFERSPVKLSIGEVSLSSAVRDLMNDRNRLSSLLIQEQERIYRKLAMDLHDDIIGDLMYVCRDIENDKTDLKETHADLLAVMHKLRSMCNELSSREVEDWGFKNALVELCQRSATKSGVDVELSGMETLPHLPDSVGLQIYRIVQECLNNALKHGRGQPVEVLVGSVKNELTIRTSSTSQSQLLNTENQNDASDVKDRLSAANSDSQEYKPTKLGLRIMSERAEIISSLGYPANLVIETDTPGRWTVILFVDISAGKENLD